MSKDQLLTFFQLRYCRCSNTFAVKMHPQRTVSIVTKALLHTQISNPKAPLGSVMHPPSSSLCNAFINVRPEHEPYKNEINPSFHTNPSQLATPNIAPYASAVYKLLFTSWSFTETLHFL
ncbi:hypothetical protein PIB30_094992 [Stylosanthes scabra]|uniref:Uncharacterized protein n=1 Tax=Stylosanthes scabra TaxID=79078 RepID=A0ABU6SVY9_9FABA|nr:hypothetical protein [Stylosanthes scabra]